MPTLFSLQASKIFTQQRLEHRAFSSRIGEAQTAAAARVANSPQWPPLPGCWHQGVWSGTELWWQQCWQHPSGCHRDSACEHPLWSATPNHRRTHRRHRDQLGFLLFFFFSCLYACVRCTFSPDTTHRDSVSMHLEFLKHRSSCLLSFTDNSDCLEWKERWFTVTAQTIWRNELLLLPVKREGYFTYVQMC